MTAPPRRLVTQIRAERVLPLPASLDAVAELLDTVHAELTAADRPVTDAEARLDSGVLVVSYPVPDDDGPRLAAVAGLR
ncbi:hypothetical protein ACFP1Z_09295 [Streptomyces gamaensis]|uniref:Uncharacterized protein n=1 Tax=Streptomyces gamaensis TaxID=1763542 RepID=A0ABW0Z130_9ACTN